MGEIVVNSTVVARFKLSRFDKFEARNRPLCIYSPLCVSVETVVETDRVLRATRKISDKLSFI